MEHASHCTHLAAEVAAFAELIAEADLTVPVPSCPGWDLGALVAHQGRVHRWAERTVATRARARIDGAQLEDRPPPGVDPASWLREGGERLVATLRAVDPDEPIWAWGTDQHARFWSRRQLHETVVHRADAALALGRDPVVDPAVALDGIDELLDNLPAAGYFATATTELRGSGETIHLHATDGSDPSVTEGARPDGEWMITLLPDRFEYTHAHGKADVAVRAGAADLLLLLYNRRSADDPRYEVFGDRARLDFWLARSTL